MSRRRAIVPGPRTPNRRVAEAEGASGYDHVERHEKMRRLSAHRHGNAQWKHGEGGDRKRPLEAPEDRGPRRRHDDGCDTERSELLRWMAQRDDARRVPHI